MALKRIIYFSALHSHQFESNHLLVQFKQLQLHIRNAHTINTFIITKFCLALPEPSQSYRIDPTALHFPIPFRRYYATCRNTHISLIHKRTIELLPYQDFLVCRLSRNESSSDFKISLHVSIKVHHVTIQDRCIANTFSSVGPLLNIESMFYDLILVVFTLE